MTEHREAEGAGVTEGAAEDRPSFPEDWRADVLATDGGVVHIRPITPDDAPGLVEFHAKLSERTRYLRYFEPYPEMSDTEIYRATHVDNHYRVALIALLGDDIIAVGVYEADPDAPHHRVADVAFVVADGHQRRGLGSILLEHLAGAAAENGIETFVASVLADNPSMVRVFEEAGYQVSGVDDGYAVHLEFAIDPSEALLHVRNARERGSEARSVGNLLSPTSIAVIGASHTPGKVGYAVLENLLRGRFNGPVFPVNASRGSVQGVRTYRTVREIPDPVDLAIVAVPAADVDDVLDDCLAKGVKGLVVLSAGFAESDEEGHDAQRRLVQEARAHGMRVVGPNALGIANTDPDVAMNATLAAELPGRGRAGFFCQSDPLGAAILREAAAQRLGLSTFVSAGNRADVSGNDLLQYWDSDPDTDVVLLYLESLGNSRKFTRIARRMARDKPIVVVRGSRVDRPEAHGGATTVDQAIAADVFHQAGVIAVDSISDMFDCATLLCHQPLPSGPRLAIVGTSTPLAWLAFDAATACGLVVTRTERLGPMADPVEVGGAVRAAMAADDVDAVLAIVAPPVPVPMEPFASPIREVAAAADKPLLTTFLGEQGIPDLLAVCGPDGMPVSGSVPSYAEPARAVRALHRAWWYASWRARPASEPTRPDGIDTERAHEIVVRATRRPDSGGWLSDVESAELLGCFGIHVVEFREVTDVDQAVAAAADLGYPVALKATGEVWRHRPDLRGVRLDLDEAAEVRRGYSDLAATSGAPLIHVQRMAVKGTGCVIRVQDDPSFGSVVSFGLSGAITELLGDRAYRSLPLGPEDAARLVVAPKAAVLFAGSANAEPADTGALAELVMRVSTLCDDIPEIREVSLEPIMASRDRAEILYARVRLGPEPTRFDVGPRRIV